MTTWADEYLTLLWQEVLRLRAENAIANQLEPPR